jgi:hypothetical protein
MIAFYKSLLSKSILRPEYRDGPTVLGLETLYSLPTTNRSPEAYLSGRRSGLLSDCRQVSPRHGRDASRQSRRFRADQESPDQSLEKAVPAEYWRTAPIDSTAGDGGSSYRSCLITHFGIARVGTEIR